MISTSSFQWRYPLAGFHWIAAKGLDGQREKRFLVPKYRTPEKRYSPFAEHPALFRSFAELEVSESAVLAFSDRYGNLGIGKRIEARKRPADRYPLRLAGMSKENALAVGERLYEWGHEVFWMAEAIRVWEALRAEGEGAIGKWFALHETREEDGTEVYDYLRYLPAEGTPFATHFWLLRYPGEEVAPPETRAQAARMVLTAVVSTGLQRGLVAPQFGEVDGVEAMALQMKPFTLLGALWTQLALAIQGDLRQIRCESCGSWFLPRPKGRRENTRFCSPRCRVAASRKQAAVREETRPRAKKKRALK